MDERVDERVEESAAEVLARLEQYVAAFRAQPAAEKRATARNAATGANAAPIDTLIPSHDAVPLRRHRFVAEVAPALIAVTICSFIILLSEWFDARVAVAVVGVLLLVGAAGLVHRVPLARAYTFGLVVAALLIRFS